MNKDGLLITIVDECLQKAREMHIETMDDFSQWLANNEWELNYTTGNWEKVNNDIQVLPFSDVYQMFLKSREA